MLRAVGPAPIARERLQFFTLLTKDPTTNTIAGATVRQLVPVVLERVEQASSDALRSQHCYEEPGKVIQALTKNIFPRFQSRRSSR